MLLDPWMSPGVDDPADTDQAQQRADDRDEFEADLEWRVARIASRVSVTRAQIEQVLRADHVVSLERWAADDRDEFEADLEWRVARIASRVSVTRAQIEQVLRADHVVSLERWAA